MEISCRNLRLGYSPKNILVENFDADFRSGIFTALIGRNGSGKSTLLKHLAGLYQCIEGEILIDKNSIANYSAFDLAKKICWIGTEKIDYPFLSVEELVGLGRHPHLGLSGFLNNDDKNIIESALTELGIIHLRKKYLSQCSDGERQSALLARALAQDTGIILLDEITAHLDYVHRHKTFDLLKKLAHNHHKTIILATHEIDLSLKYCDELMVLHDKKIQKIVAAEFQNKDLLNHVFEGLLNQ